MEKRKEIKVWLCIYFFYGTVNSTEIVEHKENNFLCTKIFVDVRSKQTL